MFAPPRIPIVRCNCPIEGCSWSTTQSGRVEPHLRFAHSVRERSLQRALEKQALWNYAKFQKREWGTVTLDEVRGSSAGISGWASANIGTLQEQLQRLQANQEEIQANQVRQEERLVKLHDEVATIREERSQANARLRKIVRDVILPQFGWEPPDED